jgi:hypothetical protein
MVWLPLINVGEKYSNAVAPALTLIIWFAVPIADNPVPPLVVAIAVPFQVPAVIVPNVVMLVEPAQLLRFDISLVVTELQTLVPFTLLHFKKLPFVAPLVISKFVVLVVPETSSV